jgi:ABC-2 type transport system ATP-binding protein
MSTPIFEVLDLRKRYGDLTALDGVSLAVEKGEVFGLLGPNGAGKTTLLSIASCLLRPTSGEVRVEGRPVSEREVRRLVGLVPQEVAVYGQLTARENLNFFGELYGLRGAALRQRTELVLKATGLEHRADGRVSTFSGGMKRRLNLGAALMHHPPLLLMDEPTTGVDPQSRNHIFEEVRRLNVEGTTIIYTSHYMEEVQALCSRIAIIDSGKVVACDSLTGLLRLLGGPVRFRVSHVDGPLLDALAGLPDAHLVESPVLAAESRNGPAEAPLLELRCRDVRSTVPRLLGLLDRLGVKLLDLQTEEPSLERVFLDLTERTLRD